MNILAKVLLAVCLFCVSASAEEIKVGSTIGYTGIYCRDHSQATALLSQIKEKGDDVPFLLVGCFAGRGTIRVVKKLEDAKAANTQETWTVVQVDGGERLFIVTTLPVVVGIGI